jgi:nucleotide-binding universal stress UspA family protein
MCQCVWFIITALGMVPIPTREDYVMLNNILLVLSGSPAAASATHYAEELAARHQAIITGAAFLDNQSGLRQAVPVGGMAYAKQATAERLAAVRERVREAAQHLVMVCRGSGREPRVVHAEGDPIELLLAEWRYHDLTVAALRSLFDHELVPDPEQSIRRLLLAGVRPILAVPEVPRPVRKVMAHCDGTLIAAKALKRFLQMRLYPDCELHLVACAESSEALRDHHERTKQYCASHGVIVTASHIIDGTPQTALLSFQRDQNMDLLVMGDGAPSLWQRMFTGDVVMDTIRRAECALFLAH